jgi:hypothetical protein
MPDGSIVAPAINCWPRWRRATNVKTAMSALGQKQTSH